jgi:hypothetical protein
MNRASSSGRSPANEAGNFSPSRNRNPLRGGRIGGTGAPGGGSAILAGRYLAKDKPAASAARPRLDVWGLVLLAPGIATVILGSRTPVPRTGSTTPTSSRRSPSASHSSSPS